MRPATASAAFINHVLDTAEQYGCNGDQLLHEIGLARERLADPILRIPMHQLRALLELAARTSGLPHFGLLVGAGVRPGTYGVLGYVQMTSATLGESMSMIRRFGKIVFDSPSSQTHIAIEHGKVLLEDRRITELEPYSVYQQEAVLAGWTAFGRWLIGSSDPVLEVQMMHPAQGDPELYERFFGCPVQFGAKRNALVFPESMLAARIQGADPRTHKSLLLEADLQLGRSYAPLSVIGRLRAFADGAHAQRRFQPGTPGQPARHVAAHPAAQAGRRGRELQPGAGDHAHGAGRSLSAAYRLQCHGDRPAARFLPGQRLQPCVPPGARNFPG